MARTRKTKTQKTFQFRWENGEFVCDEDFPTGLATFDAVCDTPIGVFEPDSSKRVRVALLQVRFRDGMHSLRPFMYSVGLTPMTVGFRTT